MKPRPPVFTYASQCHRKRRYTGKRAQELAEKLKMRVYRCQWCNGHHITSRLNP